MENIKYENEFSCIFVNSLALNIFILPPAAMYNYYVPSRYSAQGMRQQIASRGYFTTPSGAKIYSSAGDEGDNEDSGDVVNLGTGL